MKLESILTLCAILAGSQVTNAEGLVFFHNKLALPEQSWPVFYDGDLITPAGCQKQSLVELYVRWRCETHADEGTKVIVTSEWSVECRVPE